VNAFNNAVDALPSTTPTRTTVPNGEESLNDRIHKRVIADAKLGSPIRVERGAHVNVGPFPSSRKIDDVRKCAIQAGHTVDFLEVESGGRNSWIITIGVAHYSGALRRALAHFDMLRTALLVSKQKSSLRKWKLSSDTVLGEDLVQLANVLLVEAVPTPPIHENFDTPACTELRVLHPWLGDTRTSLTEGNEMKPIFSDSFIQTVDGVQALAKAVLDLSYTCKCSRKKGVETTVTQQGVGAKIVVACKGNRCASSHSVFSSGSKDCAKLNQAATVLRLTSGRPLSVDRFCANLGLGSVIVRDSKSTFVSDVFDATLPLFKECSAIVTRYAAASQTPQLGADAAHKRNEKLQAMGAALSSLVSVSVPNSGKIATVSVTKRFEIEKSRREHGGVVTIPSPVDGKPALTSTLGGVEHPIVELAFQCTRDLFDEAVVWLQKSGLSCLEKLEERARLQKQTLKQIVIDAISSGRRSVKRTFGDDIEIFLDWWHRRVSFRGVLSKVEKKVSVVRD
jgi:hypothetical protein